MIQKIIIPLFFFFSLPFFVFSTSTDSIPVATYIAQQNVPAKKATEGFYYQIEKEGRGRLPTVGDYVKLNYIGRFTSGKVFDVTEEEPFVFQVGYRQVIKGFDKGIQLFKEGSKGKLFLPSKWAYGQYGAGSKIPPHTDLIFEIELMEVMNQQEYDQYMQTLEEKERIAFQKKQREQYQKDLRDIQAYVIQKKLKGQRTPSGLFYAITKKGKGQFAKPGQRLKVKYEGFLLDGTPFDASTYDFVLNRRKVIAGWDEGFHFFNKNAEGWLVIPSKLAYGPRSIDEEIKGKRLYIPEYSVLVFKVKVLDIQ